MLHLNQYPWQIKSPRQQALLYILNHRSPNFSLEQLTYIAQYFYSPVVQLMTTPYDPHGT